MDDTGSSALLLNIIALTTITVSLITAFKLVESSSKLGAAARGLGTQFGINKLTDKVRGGVGGVAKNKALNVGARMSTAGLRDTSRLDPDSKTARALRRVGGLNRRRKFKKENTARERDRLQGDSLADFYSDREGMQGIDTIAQRRRGSAGGVGDEQGAARVAAAVAGQQRERFSEAMKLEEATLSSASTAELGRVLEQAILNGNSERAHAASALMVGRGKADAAAAGEVIRRVAGNEDPNTSEVASTAASIIRSSGADFNAVSPDLTRWASQDMHDNPATNYVAPQLNQVADNAGSYTGASAEKMATWSAHTIHRAHTAAQAAAATGTPAGARQWQTMQDQAAAILADPLQVGKLSPDQIARYTALSLGNAPPPPPP